jgi:hypothetical protein
VFNILPLVLLPYSHVPWRLKCFASQKKNGGDHINDELSLFTSSSSDVLPPLGCKLSCAMFEDLKHNDGNMSAYGFDVKYTISHKKIIILCPKHTNLIPFFFF